MENTNNNSENFGKCVHSSICVSGSSDIIYRKAYIGDWGDWDENPVNDSLNENDYELTENDIS
ncbi:hypothetical protein AR687_13735 [Flavobacteriaceae bacterium CRH]|nr:hypothetical protein AR687_13735 [Flavobacteriaceae bacterium CRH]